MAKLGIALKFVEDLRGLKATSTQVKKTEKDMGGAMSVARSFQASLAALGVGAALRSVVRIASEFQDLRVQLKTVTGSAAAAQEAFAWLQEFSATTPFQLASVTEAFVGLKARGFEPTRQSMAALGDLAAAFNKDVTTAMQAVTQAAFGEAEMLKQFGIIMRQQGDQVSITYDGMTQTIKKDSREIVAALLSLAETEFSGAAAERAETLSGSFSTLKDNVSILANAFGEELLPSLTAVNKELSKTTSKLTLTSKALGSYFDLFATGQLSVANLHSAGLLVLRKEMDKLVDSAEELPRVFKAGTVETTLNADAVDKAFQSYLELNGLLGETKKVMEELTKFSENIVVNDAEQQRQQLERVARHMAAALKHATEIAVADADFSAQFARMGEEYEAALIEAERQAAAEFQTMLDDVARSFGLAMADNLGHAVAGALTGGNVQGALSSLGSNFANLVGSQIALQVGGPQGSLGGSLLGGFASGFLGFAANQVLGSIFADKGPSTTAVNFQGSVGIFSGAVNVFFAGAQNIHEASRAMGAAARTVRGQIGDLESMLGGFFGMNLNAPLFAGGPPPGIGAGGGGGPVGDGGIGGGGLLLKAAHQMFANLTGGILGEMDLMVQQVGDQWTVNIQGLAGGMGETLEEATRNMMDAFARRLPEFIESGRITLEGMPQELVAVLLASTAQTFDELRENLQIAVEGFLSSLGPIEAELFTFFSELSVAIREQIRVGLPMDTIIAGAFNQIQAFISSVAGVDLFPQFANAKVVMEEFGMQLRRLGIVGDEARVLMERMAIAVEIFNKQLESDLWTQIANTFSMMPGNAQLAADIQARAQQARIIAEIAIAQINLQTLLEMGKISLAFFNVLNEALEQQLAWASDLSNIIAAASRSAQSFASSSASAAQSMSSAAASAASQAASSSGGTGPFAEAMSLLDSAAASFRPQLDPIARVKSQFEEIFAVIDNINNEEKRLKALARAEKLYAQALAFAQEQLLGGLRDYRESLNVSAFAPGFITDRLRFAQASFESLVNAALGGDASAIAGIQPAAQTLLQLAQEAFGTASSQYQALFALVTGSLDDVLSTDFVDPQVEATQSQTEAMIGQADRAWDQRERHFNELKEILAFKRPNVQENQAA